MATPSTSATAVAHSANTGWDAEIATERASSTESSMYPDNASSGTSTMRAPVATDSRMAAVVAAMLAFRSAIAGDNWRQTMRVTTFLTLASRG